MRILVLGGTGFVGRHLAEACLARRHTVTLFHRGRSNPTVLASAEHVVGDREVDLAPLQGSNFDVVFDTSGYEVRHVRAAARALAHSTLHYVFVSSVSVYADLARMEEGAPLAHVDDAEHAALSLEHYGALKAACELALDEILPEQTRHVRAGLILGPHDYDARFRYWLTRIAAGGEVLAPGRPSASTQAIDVRDLAAWMVRCAEERRTGARNVTGEPTSMQTLLETIRDELGSNARFRWVEDEILLSHAVGAYTEMPFWLPATLGARPVDIRRALTEGLTLRPFSETVRDTWAWMRDGWDADASVRANRKLRVPAGMSAEREAAILHAAPMQRAP